MSLTPPIAISRRTSSQLRLNKPVIAIVAAVEQTESIICGVDKQKERMPQKLHLLRCLRHGHWLHRESFYFNYLCRTPILLFFNYVLRRLSRQRKATSFIIPLSLIALDLPLQYLSNSINRCAYPLSSLFPPKYYAFAIQSNLCCVAMLR